MIIIMIYINYYNMLRKYNNFTDIDNCYKHKSYCSNNIFIAYNLFSRIGNFQVCSNSFVIMNKQYCFLKQCT